MAPFWRNYGLPYLRCPAWWLGVFLVCCLYSLPETVFSSAAWTIFLEILQFVCYSYTAEETIVVFVVDVPQRLLVSKRFRELHVGAAGFWMLPFLRNIGLSGLLLCTVWLGCPYRRRRLPQPLLVYTLLRRFWNHNGKNLRFAVFSIFGCS